MHAHWHGRCSRINSRITTSLVRVKALSDMIFRYAVARQLIAQFLLNITRRHGLISREHSIQSF
jgi:hypothetical protein